MWKRPVLQNTSLPEEKVDWLNLSFYDHFTRLLCRQAPRIHSWIVQDSFTGLLTRNFCKRSFIPQAMTHADLRPLRRSIGIDPFHFILVYAFMFRVLKSFGPFLDILSKSTNQQWWWNSQDLSIVLGGELGIRNVKILLKMCPWKKDY